MRYGANRGYFNPRDGCCGRMERLAPHHRLGDPLDKPMVLLKDIIEIFDLPDFNHVARPGEFQDRVDGLPSSQIGSAFINGNLIRK